MSDGYREVYISFKLSRVANSLLSEAAKRSGRNKSQEAKLRLESHLQHFILISDANNFLAPVEKVTVKNNDSISLNKYREE